MKEPLGFSLGVDRGVQSALDRASIPMRGGFWAGRVQWDGEAWCEVTDGDRDVLALLHMQVE